jgi:inorganic triphosphatase YgiF
MTIEKTFRITDPGTFWSLQTIDQLGEFSLSTEGVTEVTDTYLDTRKRRLLAKGYSCCKREPGKKARIILTKLGAKDDTSHQPKAWKVKLEKNINNPADWPNSKVRTRVLKIIPEKKLQPMFALHQRRIIRRISKDDQDIAQANLDDVSLAADGKEQNFKILEIEMLVLNGKDHLGTITKLLRSEWSLEVEPLTRFERALAMVRSSTK